MEKIIYVMALGSLLVGLPLMPTQAQSLERYRWQNRILLVFAPAATDRQYLKQQELWERQEREFAERDLLVAEVMGQQPNLDLQAPTLDAAKLRAQYRVKAEEFAVILVGKDGGEKYRATRPVEAKVIYALIDGMPMGKAEMREQKKNTQ